MKIQLNSINFYEDISPQEEIIDSNESSTKLIPSGKSGIHIKKENRGSFTSYCGGKVTDACIRKAKKSPSAAIRKKATFADNARHWSKKHQKGGKLDLSALFIDVDSPTEFASRRDWEDYNIDDINITAPASTEQTEETAQKTAAYELPEFLRSPRAITAQADHSGDVPATPEKQINPADNPILKYIQPHLGKPYRVGNYDCSNFVSRVLKDMGYGVFGNCRTLYNRTSRIDMSQVKPGDLIFLQNTQPGKVGKGLASHVAMVTNTDRLGEGIIEVAHNGRTGGVSNITEWNLNNGFYHDHLLGAGRPVRQARHGMKFFQLGGSIPFVNPIDPFEDHDAPSYFARNYPLESEIDFSFDETSEPEEQEEETVISPIGYTLPEFLSSPRSVSTPSKQSTSQKATPTYSGKGYEDFKSKWDEYIKNNPDASKYEGLLTAIAKHESNFNPTIQNTAGAPAYGYFQFWEDGKTNNISHYSGLSIEDFRNNPLAQIEAAVKMARSIENQFNSEDLRIAKAKGYNMNQLIRGAWLGGVGGVRKVLRDQGDPSDNKWYKNGKGRSVKQAMDEQI